MIKLESSRIRENKNRSLDKITIRAGYNEYDKSNLKASKFLKKEK